MERPFLLLNLGSLCFASLLTSLHTLQPMIPDKFSAGDAGGVSHQGTLSLQCYSLCVETRALGIVSKFYIA